MKPFWLWVVVLATAAISSAADAPKARDSQSHSVCVRCIEAHEDFLASDALGGRGSATHDELVAAEYIASELEQYGIQPAAGENGDPSAGRLGEYIQKVELRNAESLIGPKRVIPSVSTRNVIGIIPGSDVKLKSEIVLLSAHLDHLGTRPDKAVNGDAIYNGADDDASGTTAVLELARALAAGPAPKRTVMFALFGSEELGGYGDGYFLEHLNFPLARIVANLEFEMIGRADPAVAPHTLWLTGWERTNLGPELARHGARLVADPHPEHKFFSRSDNYNLALKGIVAQTVSSYGLHKQYHKPDDDIAHLDLAHMNEAIGSMIVPVQWLVNSNFKPEWNVGGKPGGGD
jgi:hypothetical protein